MSVQPSSDGLRNARIQASFRTTRNGVVERLADPYLTEHDRWVLRQFAQFLGGATPGPDPRVTPTSRPQQPLYPRLRRRTL
jgi:hypothetical protein